MHSSVAAAARVMDVDILDVPHDERGRLTGEALRTTLDADGGEGIFAVVASAGATNAGTVDDLAGVADVCAERGLWFHVDGAYGGGGLLAPSIRGLFDGIERADSFIVDPHKWLFAPYDACALLYRDPSSALAAHRQEASLPGHRALRTGLEPRRLRLPPVAAGRADCRCGSRWPPTAPTPTATRWSRCSP